MAKKRNGGAPSFERFDAERGDGEDTPGKVRIYIRRIDTESGAMAKGALTRTMTVRNAKVSEVADAIERALFK